jgi:hypothetical protein
MKKKHIEIDLFNIYYKMASNGFVIGRDMLTDDNGLDVLLNVYPAKLKEFRDMLDKMYHDFKDVKFVIDPTMTVGDYKRLDGTHKEIRARAAFIRELMRKIEKVYDNIERV